MPYKKVIRQPLKMLLQAYDINTGEKLAKIIGVRSANTGRAKLNDTSRLTVGDLDRINRFGHIPIDEIRAAIGKGE